MLRAKDVGDGLALIEGACGVSPTPAQVALWHEIWRTLEPDTFRRAVVALISNTHGFFHAFPPPGAISPFLAQKVDPAVAELEGRKLFELVAGSTVHKLKCKGLHSCSCTHSRWDADLIGEKYGPAARSAFLAAGGERAFANAQEEDPWMVKKFAEAYSAEVVQAPASAVSRDLIAAPGLRLLAGGRA